METKKDKILEVKKIYNLQKKIHNKIIRISKLEPSNKIKIQMNRALKVFFLFSQIRALEFQKQVIISQPIAKFKKGSVLAIVGINKGNEQVIKWTNKL